MMKEKRNNYKFWYSPVALILLLCVFVLFGYNIIGLIEKEKETSNKKEIILEKINNLQKKETSLSLNIAKLETEEGKEEIIRDKYKVVKDGEKMVIIVNEDRENLESNVANTDHGFLAWFKKVFKF